MRTLTINNDMQKYQHERRTKALARLVNQLETNQKTTKDGSLVTLTEKDKGRITKEVVTLKNRV